LSTRYILRVLRFFSMFWAAVIISSANCESA
jgi:hypothetical protein